MAGSALIIGAFAAGLILSGTNQFDTIEREIRPVGSILHSHLLRECRRFSQRAAARSQPGGSSGLLGVALVLTLLAVAGKVAAGWAAPWAQFRRLVVGVGMIPRGEVGLIFADMGRRAGILNEAVFGAILLMIMATTFVAPPGLKLLFGAQPPDLPK